MIKLFLYPLSILYGIVVSIRNFMFNTKLLHSQEFDQPVISVGNITVGGTGKTPHTEYLIRLLSDEFKVATLSRGYKRKTSGFIFADDTASSISIGDEPMQMKNKFPNIQVAVDEKRVRGIKLLFSQEDDRKPDIILLDDAFQHRYVKPGINIALIDYNRPVGEDQLLPVGRLRESTSALRRAGIIIITKCPPKIKPIDRRIFSKELNIRPYQNLFFTTLEYGNITPAYPDTSTIINNLEEMSHYASLLITGIANPALLEKYVMEKIPATEILNFPDHHTFTGNDMKNILERFYSIQNFKKIIITTEKDVMRFRDIAFPDELKPYLYYIPLKIRFLDNEEKQFDRKILNYVRENKSNFDLHSRKNKLQT